MNGLMRGGAAIVGAAESDLGQVGEGFNVVDLMAALVRGGWVIPGQPDRSMFLEAIIGTGPMQSVLADADVQLLKDWVTAGAMIPGAGG